MAERIHSSNRLEDLADALAHALETPLSSPFVKETVLVPSRALGAWLSTELAKRHGICANIEFVTPNGWLRMFTSPDTLDVFAPEVLEWSVAARLPALLEDPAFEDVLRYLSNDRDSTKRLALATRIARVFDRYIQHRPDMITEWQRGADDHWQAKLFRTLVSKHGMTHLAARVDAFIQTLSAAKHTDLPERLAMFCVDTRSPLTARILDAIAPKIPLSMFELTTRGSVARGETVLAHVQNAIGGAVPTVVKPLDASDHSVSVHACHSKTRECEVLRDQILDAIARDPTLEPRDVVVLSPDLASYAAAIDSVFGADPKGPHHLPYRIADRRSGSPLPVIEALLALLEAASSRLPAPAVVDLLFREPIRARFQLSEPDVETIRTWVLESRIRWAVDEEDRADQSQPKLRQNTWRFGIDRLLLGYAAGEDGEETFADVLPFADVDGSAASELGAFVEFCEALFSLREELRGHEPVITWCLCIRTALARFVAAGRQTEYQHQIVRGALDAIVARVTEAGFTEDVPLSVVRDALGAELEERGGGFAMGSGPITFAAVAPGRCVPARVVALLGMSDGDFPRAPRALGFDLLTSAPREADPSPREEDRRVFAEAIFAAREQLVVTYIGRSIKNDAEQPPSVVISELLDTIDAAYTWNGEPASRHLVVRHALHAFSPRYFRADDARYFSYATTLARAASAMTAARVPLPRFVEGPLPASPAESQRAPVTVDELCTFFDHPTVAFVSRRVGAFLGGDVEPLEDREPFELDGLKRWFVQERLVGRARVGEDVSTIPRVVGAAGELPLGTVGSVLYETLHEAPAAMGEHVRELLGEKQPAPLEIDMELEDDERLLGWLRTVGPNGQVLFRFSKARGKHELAAWIRHLAMIASGKSAVTFLVSRGDDVEPSIQRFGPVEDAKKHLSHLLTLYRRGQQSPLPLFPDPASAYAWTLKEGGSAQEALAVARRVYFNGYDGAANAYVSKVYADTDPLDAEFIDLATRVFGPLHDHLEDAS